MGEQGVAGNQRPCGPHREAGSGYWVGVCLWLVFTTGCSNSLSVPPTASIPQLVPVTTIAVKETRETPAPSDDVDQQMADLTESTDGPQRDWKFVVLHHTATRTGSVDSIHNMHLKKRDGRGNPWLGIGYHFVIGNGQGMPDGEIQPTFRWKQQLQGAHAGDRQHNDSGIGIVLVGNFDQHEPTPHQQQSVVRLVRQLSNRFGIESTRVIGHGDIKATACPGRHFSLDALRSSLTSLDDSGGHPLARFVPETGIPRKEALRR